LFEAYPELASYAFRELEPTHKKFTAPQNAYGFYSPGQSTITVNTDAPFKRSTALHELQHAIQEIEGWQGGSSPEEMAARLADRDIAKTREADLLQSIQDMQKILPPSANNLILTEGQKLKNIQDFLNKTKQLEGETDPYDAYRKVSGEEEARMVQARRDYPEEKLAERPPFLDYEAKPWEHITEFAAGGEVHMNKGGVLGRVVKTAEKGMERAMQGALPQVNRIDMHYKDVGKRIPALEEAIAALERGEITKQQYAQLVQAYKPVTPFQEFFKPETDERIINALTKTNREKEGTPPKQTYFGIPSSTLKRGEKAATRQDIPSYTNEGTWVVTVHEPQQGRNVYAGAGPRIGYEPMAMLNDVKFQVRPDGALKIARGGQKGTIATMEGYWEPITRGLAEEMGPELMRDPRWVQAGMDPTRSASFYNRETMQPIVEGEQVLHSGPLVLVKNPVYGDIEDFPFKEGGEIRAAKGGLLGALAKTAEKGLERAAKAAVPVAQRAIVGAQDILPAAEREANLAKLLKESKVPQRLYHGTSNDFSEFTYNPDKALGIWAATQPELAGQYSEIVGKHGKNPSVMPLHMVLKNPAKQKDLEKATKQAETEPGMSWGTINRRRREILQSQGFDGVDLGDSVVSFDPTQVKSAIGNRGTYDIEDPDINRANGGGVTIDEFLKRIKAK